MAALSYDANPNVMIVGVGLMGQYLAKRVGAARLAPENVDVTSEDSSGKCLRIA